MSIVIFCSRSKFLREVPTKWQRVPEQAKTSRPSSDYPWQAVQRLAQVLVRGLVKFVSALSLREQISPNHVQDFS